MLRYLSWLVSIVFHPLLVPSYMLLLLLLCNPFLFGVSSIMQPGADMLLLVVFLYTFVMPAIAVAVMYFLGMVSRVDMPDKQERIGPYLVTGILYMWVYYNFKQNGQMPPAFTDFMLGVVIALFLAFFINLFSKISVHAVGMGGLVGMLLITIVYYSQGSLLLPWGAGGFLEIKLYTLLMLGILLAGLVGTSRLALNAHEPNDVFGGYLVGFSAQLVALWF